MKTYLVRYETKMRGTVLIEANSPEEAKKKVDDGDFDSDLGEERVDWESIGDAEEDK